MRKIFYIINLMILSLILVSCGQVYKVTFDLNGGTGDIKTQEIKKNKLATKPIDPSIENGSFAYWSDEAGNEFLFTTKITRDYNLKASYNLEEEENNNNENNGNNNNENNENKSEQKLLDIDFGFSSVTGYDTTSITFKNSDNKSYTVNKNRAQINSKSGSDNMLLVLAPVKDKVESFIEFDLSHIAEPTKAEFYIAGWSEKSANAAKSQNNAEFKLQYFNNNTWVDASENLISQLNGEDLKLIQVELSVSAKYRFYFKIPQASSTTNTTYAIVIDDISVYGMADSDGTSIITFDYGYEGPDKLTLIKTVGEKLSEPDNPERLSFEFIGWYLGNDLYDFDEELRGDLNLVAKWNKTHAIFKYDLGHLDEENISIKLNLLNSKPEKIVDPIRDGYEFLGWFESDISKDNNSLFNFNNNATKDIRLVASWNKIFDNPVYERNDEDLALYYSSIKGTQGEDLFNSLRTLLISSHTPVNYGEARYALEDADRHPYNESMVLTMYDRDMVYGPWNHPIWEREHVWPNSKLGVARADNDTVNQASDLHNLRAIIPTVNQRRGNKYFVTTNYDNPIGHFVGEGYYPGDEDKGDVARILLYMVIRYEDLTLTNDVTLLRLEDFNNTVSGAYMGLLSNLLTWHLEDPVDEFEINRNNVIFTNQKNRNPFIDHPELFEEVWSYLTSVEESKQMSFNIEISTSDYILNVDITFINKDKRKFVI